MSEPIQVLKVNLKVHSLAVHRCRIQKKLVVLVHFSPRKYSSASKMSQRVHFSILADILKYRMTFARLSQDVIIKLKLKSMELRSRKHRHISIRKLKANFLPEHSSLSKNTTTPAVDIHESGQVCWLVLHISLLQPKVSLEDSISRGAVQGRHSWELH